MLKRKRRKPRQGDRAPPTKRLPSSPEVIYNEIFFASATRQGGLKTIGPPALWDTDVKEEQSSMQSQRPLRFSDNLRNTLGLGPTGTGGGGQVSPLRRTAVGFER
mmetsp:Transcript_34477/g.77465  ORF Transcript_34477/g.77465 Transcript_34477/m.77465 type:complete len:105 (+) Transcript_34477:960-1274(+)